MAADSEAGGTHEAEVNASKPKTGIPEAPFVEDVDAYMQQPENNNTEAVLRRLDELHMKYKFLDLNLVSKKRRLKTQIPEIEKSLELLKEIGHRRLEEKPMETHFLLSEQLYAKATIPPTNTVGLWLGANVMLEYSVEDAQALLDKNLEMAQKNLRDVDRDLDFLRDQTTTTEVTMARIYNWDVKQRKASASKE